MRPAAITEQGWWLAEIVVTTCHNSPERPAGHVIRDLAQLVGTDAPTFAALVDVVAAYQEPHGGEDAEQDPTIH